MSTCAADPTLKAMLAVTTFDWITLVIAGLGLVLAISSFTWQLVTWTYTGAKVKVDTGMAFTNYRLDLQSTSVVVVEARNVGRSPVEVKGWGVRLPDGRDWVLLRGQPPTNKTLPLTLAGYHAATWLLPIGHLAQDDVLGIEGDQLKLHGWVDLANGKRVTSGKPVSVPKSSILSEHQQPPDTQP